MKQYTWLFVVIMILLSLVVIMTASKKCGCGQLETFCGCGGGLEGFTSGCRKLVETAKPTSIYCAEYLVYNGHNYELWRDSRITHVFHTYKDYLAYLEFANASNTNKGVTQCIPLKPMTRTGFDGVVGANGQGSIVPTQFIQEPRFYNLEHFISGSLREGFETQRDVAVDSSTLLLETEKTQKNDYLNLSQEILADYMKQNPGCYDKMKDKNGDFYRIFQESYGAFIRHQFLRRLGYVPDRPDLRDLNMEEAATYVDILKILPACQALILNYSPYAQAAPGTMKGVSSLFVREGFEDVSNETKKVLSIEVDTSFLRNINKSLDSIQSSVKGLFLGSIPEETKTASSTMSKASVSVERKEDDNTSYGSYSYDAPKSTMATEKRPMSTPSQMHVAKRSLDGSVQRLPYEYDLRESSVRPEFRAPVVSPGEDEDNKLTQLSQGRMQSVGSVDLDLDYLEQKKEPGLASDHIAANFAYTPDMEKPEQPKRIATTYGWSFMPPPLWSVPQKRPPICLPETGKVSNVVPIYDKSVPTDVLEWTQVKYETENDIQRRPVDSSLLASYYSPGLFMSEDQHTLKN
jgi:hypothetical protein